MDRNVDVIKHWFQFFTILQRFCDVKCSLLFCNNLFYKIRHNNKSNTYLYPILRLCHIKNLKNYLNLPLVIHFSNLTFRICCRHVMAGHLSRQQQFSVLQVDPIAATPGVLHAAPAAVLELGIRRGHRHGLRG